MCLGQAGATVVLVAFTQPLHPGSDGLWGAQGWPALAEGDGAIGASKGGWQRAAVLDIRSGVRAGAGAGSGQWPWGCGRGHVGALEVLCTGIVSQPDVKQQPGRQEEHVGQGHSAT